MSVNNRKRKLESIVKQAAEEALIAKIAQEATQQSTNSAEYSEQVFQKLLESITLEELLKD
jgi:hypothetical protein